MRTALLASVSLCLLSAATAPPADARPVDRRALSVLLARARESSSDAVVVYKDGALVGQWYFGRPQGPIEAMSATKSIVNLAIGRLIYTRKIRSIDQPVSDFFPEWRQGRKRAITIRHLLNHTSGLQNEPNTGVEIYPSRDFVKLALAAELTAAPGAAFAYNNKAVNLLAGVVKVVSGKRMDQYVRDEIFAPLGITEFFWTLDDAGNPHAMSGLQIRALDLARIGQMMLQGGTWRGKTIVPRSWIEQSTRAGQDINPRCGLLWWRLGDFRYRAASDELIATWRRGGASDEFIARMRPLKGVVYAGRKQMRAALERAFPAAPDQPSLRDQNTWMKGLPDAEVLPGPVHGYAAEGYLGQYLVVIPSEHLIAVRQMRSPSREDPAHPPDSFEEFPEMVRALVGL
jgi:CubicO group peptidase (beta-lactamase class C family)